MMKPVMVIKSKSAGFTLVEVTLVLAITASLAVIVFSGQRTLREQAQFSSSIEQLVGTFSYAKNAAATTVNSTHGATTNSPDILVWGTVLEIKTCGSSPSITRSTLKTRPGVPDKLDLVDSSDIILPYQICYQPSSGGSTFIAFFRERETGQLQTYQISNLGQVKRISNYSSDKISSSTISLHFQDSANHSADVTIDPKTNSISRIFN